MDKVRNEYIRGIARVDQFKSEAELLSTCAEEG